jgi:methylated-DNA-[protein]-cysteine S-methyltransferase
MQYLAEYASPIGTLTIASDGEQIIGLWMGGQKYFAATLDKEVVEKPELAILAAAANWLDSYFAGERPAISSLPLAPKGSDFRQQVWDILCQIPYGQTTTYGAIAKKIAASTNKPIVAAQAVGGAVGHNPISIIIPCHRVVGASGSLTGYAGGFDKKIWLLTHEGLDIDVSRNRIAPTRQPK